MYEYEPEKWEKLKQLDKEVEKRVIEKHGEYKKEFRYKANYSFEELEEKFKERQLNLFGKINEVKK